MTDEQPTLTIEPLLTAGNATARARALVEIGFYVETAPGTFRLTETGYRWIVLWLPHIIPEIIDRSKRAEQSEPERPQPRLY